MIEKDNIKDPKSENYKRITSHRFYFLREKSFYFHLLIGSFCTLLLFYLLLVFLNLYTLNGEEFELQNFQSLTINEMKKEIELSNLNYIVTDSVYTDSVPKGTIYTQDPLAGTFVKEGRKIYFTVNCNSSQRFILPDVFNKSEREAVNKLKTHFMINFVKSDDYSEVSSVVTKMKVGNLEVYPGQKLIEGTTVTLFFGSGRSTNRINVPDLIGMTMEDAVLILQANNLKLGQIITEGEITDTIQSLIINQRPLSDSKLQIGDMVDILIIQSLDSLNVSDTILIQ